MPDITKSDEVSSLPLSQNTHAARVMGRRLEHHGASEEPVVILFAPVEQGFSCPVHKQSIEQNPDTLHWSEYNSFLWCEQCDRDYPSALCATDLDHAITVFLNSVESATKRRERQQL